ncbi:hypothetical protein L1887_40715 [Cichorium endivia]|nr:hypothetical protein L1887_40715 [Cichorium endivia]
MRFRKTWRMTGPEPKDKTKAGEGSGGISHDSPYYLYPSDVPKQLHVNEVLTDANYTDWSQEMENFLFANNKFEFVDGTIEKPEKGCSEYMPWMRCDAMVKGWLTTAMEKNIRDSVKYASTAAQMWSDLRERFGNESSPRAYELKQKIVAARQDGAFVSTYYTNLRTLWDEASSILPLPKCSCNNCTCEIGKRMSEYQEKERLYQFLMGLDAEFMVIKTQILATKPTPSLGTVYHLVAEDERQRSISNEKRAPSEPAAFKAFQGRNRSFNPSKEKSFQKSIKENKEKKENDQCTFCGKSGHKREGCFKLVGYPDWWPRKKGEKGKATAACTESKASPIPELTQEQYQMFVKHFTSANNNEGVIRSANMAGNKNEKGDWIVDTGCTEHITYTPDLLKNKKITPFESPVVIPNGNSIPVEGKGECTLPGGVKLKGKIYTRNLIGAGRRRGGLYRMGMIEERKAMATMTDVWHRRLGHASKGKLSKVDLFKNNLVNFSSENCDSCAKPKLVRTPFPISTIKSKATFELIHCDIWGGYRIRSYTNANYFLTVVDDYSRAVWVFLIKHKSDASQCLIDFHKMIKVQSEKNVKRIRCDNGGEFTSNLMRDFYSKEGILLETTYPHTPQQNGMVERKHRHLLEMARAIRFQANIPKRFWGECILTAAYIINRLPSKIVKNKTPYELVWNAKPQYDHMKVFGCLTYFKNTNTKGDKFEQKGKLGVFLGYPQGTKGYKVYDIKERKIMISRDVLFCENIFPFKKIQTDGLDENNGPFKLQHDTWEENQPQAEPIQTEPDSNTDGPTPQEQEDGNQNSPSPEINLNIDPSPSPTTDMNQTGENSELESRTRSTQTRTQPQKFRDYLVKLPPSVSHEQLVSDQETSTVHPISNFVSYKSFSTSHKAYLGAISSDNEPTTFSQAS